MPVRAAGRAIVAAVFLSGASASLAQSPQGSSRDQKPQPKPVAPLSLAAAAPQTLDVVAVSPQALTAAVSR